MIRDWRGRCVKASDEEVQKYFGTMKELEVSKFISTDAEKDVNEGHRSIQVYCSSRPIKLSKTA